MEEFIIFAGIPALFFLGIAGFSQMLHQQDMESYKVVTECRKSVKPDKNPDVICGTLPDFKK